MIWFEEMWEVVGHERAVLLLKLSLKKGCLAHAYLFTGPPHVGKMTLALDLARAVNCEGAEVPCGECEGCLRISTGKHADVRIIGLADGEGQDKPRFEIGIDQVREIERDVNLPPFEGKCKVFIIDGAERLSGEAANCLLKTLEEPVGRVMFILLTPDERQLPPTIVSRCQHLKLSSVPLKEIESAVSSRTGVAAEKTKLLSRLSRGCPGWALAAAQDEEFLQKRNERVEKALGLLSADLEVRFGYGAELVSLFGRDSGKVREILDEWISLWRDLLLVRLGLNKMVTNIDLEPELIRLVRGLEIKEIKNFIRDVDEAEAELLQNVSPRLVFDVLMLAMPRREG